jgi:hypothetical protein
MRMNAWAIDVYGLREAHRQSVLARLRDAHRLYVSPLTWFPSQPARTGNGKSPRRATRRASENLALVGRDPSRARGAEAGEIHETLHALHQRGMLVVEEDHECDPHLVATVETSWKNAGLIGRPTDETLTAILTAGRLGMDLVTEDTDVHKLAGHWEVQTLTVSDLASSLAA